MVEEVDQLEPLRDEWDDLLAKTDAGLRIFSTWDWQRLWWRAFGEASTLRLLAIRNCGRLEGIWPLYNCDGALALVGGADVCDYLDVIAVAGRERELLAAGLQHLAEQGVRDVDLRFVPADSATIIHLPELAESFGWTVQQTVDDVCPTVAVPEDWESYLGSLSKKDRHELRRKLRRLSEAGEPEWQLVSGTLEQDVVDFIHLHRLSQPVKAAFMDRAMEEFFHSIIAHFGPRGLIKIYFLALSGHRVAATMCLEQGDELWVYNSGFDREYGQYSVGLALKAFCIKDAIARGKRKVDFLRGREPYKYDLGAQDVPAYRLRLGRA